MRITKFLLAKARFFLYCFGALVACICIAEKTVKHIFAGIVLAVYVLLLTNVQLNAVLAVLAMLMSLFIVIGIPTLIATIDENVDTI